MACMLCSAQHTVHHTYFNRYGAWIVNVPEEEMIGFCEITESFKMISYETALIITQHSEFQGK